MRSVFPIFLLGILLFSCSKTELKFTPSELEEFRPLYHFTPAKGWMNDPNGLIYVDGEYHLFFQYYPDSTVWGPMHWGHAISKDLISWEELPIALYPDSLGYIFSGSAVYDSENSSGLGTSENPPLVAIYTYHDMEGEKSGRTDFQSQAIAYSLDKGRTWVKYEGNPVLPNQGIKDFRDPKVSQLTQPDGSKQWVMTLAVRDRIQFFGSKDLKEWTLLSEFGQGIGAHGGVWECPDLLPFTAPDGSQKWVLLVSLNPGGPQKGSATQYFIGDFQNGTFTADDTMIRWLDYGPDNYAGVTWANLPPSQNRTLFIGWMSNWLYAQVVPTATWRSALTVPRELTLFDVNGTLLLKSAPAGELQALRQGTFEVSDQVFLFPSQAVEIHAEIEKEDSFSLILSNELGEQVLISKEMGLVNIDRSRAGKASFQEDFAAVHTAPMSWKAKELRIFLDASSIELFVNDGELVMTSLLFPNSPWKKLEIQNGLDEVKIYPLKNLNSTAN
jgi:fructan beta-fructosidase